MKKINNSNNKYRGNAIYSLNYKFDSVSSAGKFSGTALELIKKYNELAKEAQSNGNYVEMEVFRQYAEHYRKIVTEINERKNQNRENIQESNDDRNISAQELKPLDNGLVETESAVVSEEKTTTESDVKSEKKVQRRRNFKIIGVSAEDADGVENEQNSEDKPRRRILGRRSKTETMAESTPEEQDN